MLLHAFDFGVSRVHVAAVACEGANHESLQQAEEIVAAGKHLWMDKPAGANTFLLVIVRNLLASRLINSIKQQSTALSQQSFRRCFPQYRGDVHRLTRTEQSAVHV